jgi:hypothetical protein
MYVYGLTTSGRAVGGRGVADAPVSTVEHGELAAIVSHVGDDRIRAKRRDLLRHSDVLQSAFASGPVVPLRFGTVFESEEAVVDGFLGARYEELVGLLQWVEGLVELRVRATFREQELLAEIVAGDPAIAALRNAPDTNPIALGEAVARAVAAERAAAADEIVETLAAQARDVQVDEPREELEVVRASFLVLSRDTKAFEEAAAGHARRQRDRMTIELIGPMPPHSFVALDGRRGA